MTTQEKWWAKGILLESCNCQLLCPAHVNFKQRCTNEVCHAYWAPHIEEGRFGAVPLDGLNAVLAFETPQVMASGGWTQAIYIDERADEAQRQALERIFSGLVGAGWAVLAQFVAKRLETRFVPIHFRDEGRRRKSMLIEGYFATSVETVKGADRTREVALENAFNQIHGPSHILCLGTTRYADQGLSQTTEGSHALYSRFSWTGP